MMQADTDTKDFIHPELGREITAIGGHYVFCKEVRSAYNGRELLYFVGYAVLDSTCCGVGGTAYVLVPGFIRQWKYKKNHNDFMISKMDPIRNHIDQKDIRKCIQNKEKVFQVTFD
mgnify:CR=1 FL=1